MRKSRRVLFAWLCLVLMFATVPPTYHTMMTATAAGEFILHLPVIYKSAYSETFPLDNVLTLGSCAQLVHDRYAVYGPDGRQYRTWHPVTVPVDPGNPAAGTCTFAHEHGDPPHPAGSLPLFGYAAAVHGMFTEITAHTGFKVFSHYADGRSGLGSPEVDYAGLPLDFTLTIHQGSGGRGRLFTRFHSFEFWGRDSQGRETHVYAMADTGQAFDKAFGGGADARDRFIVSHAAHVYETWGFAVNVGGAWNSGGAFAAVTNPMNHAHGAFPCADATCSNIALVNTSEEMCGHLLVPCNEWLPFGRHGAKANIWLGHFRTLHEPDWTWTNAGGASEFCTNALGVRQACGASTILQRVAPVSMSNAGAHQLLRTNNEAGWDAVYYLPLGAPGGN